MRDASQPAPCRTRASPSCSNRIRKYVKPKVWSQSPRTPPARIPKPTRVLPQAARPPWPGHQSAQHDAPMLDVSSLCEQSYIKTTSMAPHSGEPNLAWLSRVYRARHPRRWGGSRHRPPGASPQSGSLPARQLDRLETRLLSLLLILPL